MNGAAEKIIIGVATLVFSNTSVIAPPDTERKALPAKPVKKRKIKCTDNGPAISEAE